MKAFGFLFAASIGTTLGGCVSAPPLESVMACQDGIVEWAEPYDPVRIDTVSLGQAHWNGEGHLVTPLHVRIVYDRQGGLETREADVKCQVDEEGTVVAVM